MKVRPHVILLWVFVGALALLAVMLAVPAYAATTIGPQSWNRYAGTRIIAGPFATLEDCANATIPGNYTCRVSIRVIVTDDPAECDPLPGPVTEQRQCPEGTVGTWQQTRAYIREPYPLCQTAGPWVPAEPPDGACEAPEPPPPPPPPTGWTHCANEDQRCSFSGTRRVRYGIDTRWIERDVTDGIACSNQAFGSDPAHGVDKVCQTSGTSTDPPPPPPDEPPPPPDDPPPPPPTGTIALRWEPPTLNEDGSALTDLAGYRPRCAQGTAVLTGDVPSAITRFTFDAVAPGAWTCTVTAYNARGAESRPSGSAATTVP